MNRVLLDTNAYSQYLRGDEAVLDAISSARQVYMSAFVMGELYAGFKGGVQNSRKLFIPQAFLNKPSIEIINATIETAEIFAHIKDQLKRSGHPIPINDVWIAAHTFETATELITYDHHFKYIEGIRMWNV